MNEEVIDITQDTLLFERYLKLKKIDFDVIAPSGLVQSDSAHIVSAQDGVLVVGVDVKNDRYVLTRQLFIANQLIGDAAEARLGPVPRPAVRMLTAGILGFANGQPAETFEELARKATKIKLGLEAGRLSLLHDTTVVPGVMDTWTRAYAVEVDSTKVTGEAVDAKGFIVPVVLTKEEVFAATRDRSLASLAASPNLALRFLLDDLPAITEAWAQPV